MALRTYMSPLLANYSSRFGAVDTLCTHMRMRRCRQVATAGHVTKSYPVPFAASHFSCCLVVAGLLPRVNYHNRGCAHGECFCLPAP